MGDTLVHKNRSGEGPENVLSSKLPDAANLENTLLRMTGLDIMHSVEFLEPDMGFIC